MKYFVPFLPFVKICDERGKKCRWDFIQANAVEETFIHEEYFKEEEGSLGYLEAGQ